LVDASVYLNAPALYHWGKSPPCPFNKNRMDARHVGVPVRLIIWHSGQEEYLVKVKVKFPLGQATKAQMESRDIDLPFS